NPGYLSQPDATGRLSREPIKLLDFPMFSASFWLLDDLIRVALELKPTTGGFLVFAHCDENWMPHSFVRGPFRKLYFGDQLRLEPLNRFVRFRNCDERTVI